MQGAGGSIRVADADLGGASFVVAPPVVEEVDASGNPESEGAIERVRLD